jgi:hypothetical protein
MTPGAKRWLSLIAVQCASALLWGCSLNPATRNTLAGAGVLGLGMTPSANLEQVYYLGVFDPQEQHAPTLYRVRVRGQASALNASRFASGWVHADLIDSLSTAAKFSSRDPDAALQVMPATGEDYKSFATGRRLVMFGPEGFREAPANHRLVIALGSSPDKFFSAVDQALGNVAAATQGLSGPALERDLFREILRLKNERDRLQDLQLDAKTSTSSGSGQ